MIRVLIVDDEPMACSKLRRLLRAEADVEVVGEARNVAAAREALQQLEPEVVFLDIDMPDGTGFDLVREHPAPPPWIVFATAYSEFAVQAFEVEALDYLLKPFDAERVARVLARVRRRRAEDPAEAGARNAALLRRMDATPPAAGAPPAWARRLLVQEGQEMRLVRVDQIDWLSSADNYVEVHVGPASHLIRDTLNAVEQRLDPSSFARIHRRTIVHLDRVAAIRGRATGQLEVELADGTVLAVGRAYRDALTRRWHGGEAARP